MQTLFAHKVNFTRKVLESKDTNFCAKGVVKFTYCWSPNLMICPTDKNHIN